jgi:hypothetical protein
VVLLYIMTVLLPDVIYTTTANVLAAAQSAFTPKEIRDFDSYISHGPAAEGCCKLLVAYADDISSEIVQTRTSNNSNSIKDTGIYVYTTDITISLRECPPSMGLNGEQPDPDAIDAYAKLTYTHVWKIIAAIICARRAGTLLAGGTCMFNTAPSAQMIEEQGNCAGWDIKMTVELSS